MWLVLFQHKVNKYFNYCFMIDNTSICNIYLLKFIVFDGVSKMYHVCLASSKKGRPWEGTGEIGREKHARPQLPRPSFLKGQMSILDPPSMIHTRPQLHRSSLIKDGRAYWTFNKHAPRPKHKGQTIIFWSEASINPYEMPIQIK